MTCGNILPQQRRTQPFSPSALAKWAIVILLIIEVRAFCVRTLFILFSEVFFISKETQQINGEIRDKETMEAALKASETGHLVLSTLHTNDAVQTINRIVNMFEESNRYLIRKQLAETLRATIAQKLVYSEQANKRFPACEIMVVTSTIKDYITKDNTEEIYELLRDNTVDDMISMNTSLAVLTDKGCITQEEALKNSNDEPELEKIFRGVYQGTKAYYE